MHGYLSTSLPLYLSRVPMVLLVSLPLYLSIPKLAILCCHRRHRHHHRHPWFASSMATARSTRARVLSPAGRRRTLATHLACLRLTSDTAPGAATVRSQLVESQTQEASSGKDSSLVSEWLSIESTLARSRLSCRPSCVNCLSVPDQIPRVLLRNLDVHAAGPELAAAAAAAAAASASSSKVIRSSRR